MSLAALAALFLSSRHSFNRSSYLQVTQMSRSSEEFLASLHGLVGEQIRQLLMSDDPRDIKAGIDAGMKFLRDNNITAELEVSPQMGEIHKLLPTAEELEKIMAMTPD